MIIKPSNIITRLKNQPSLEDCLRICGVAVDQESSLSITSFCWVNGLDVGMVAFDVETMVRWEDE